MNCSQGWKGVEKEVSLMCEKSSLKRIFRSSVSTAVSFCLDSLTLVGDVNARRQKKELETAKLRSFR